MTDDAREQPAPRWTRPRLRPNPVLDRELRERMRSVRTPVVLTFHLSILVAILWLAYTAASLGEQGFGSLAVTRSATVGRSVFEWVLLFLLLLVVFLGPGLTAGAIAGERQRRTLVPLQLTLLRPRSILAGKIGASTSFLVFLIVATLPILAVAHLLGGTTLGQVFGSMLAIVFLAVVIGTLSVTCSAVFGRSQAATVAAYGLVLALLGGTFALFAAAAIVDGTRGVDEVDPPTAILTLNPVVLLADVAGADVSGSSAPLSGLRSALDLSGDRNPFEEEVFFEPGGPLVGGPFGRGPVINARRLGERPLDEADVIPFWVWSVVSLTVIACAGFVLSARRLRLPSEVDR